MIFSSKMMDFIKFLKSIFYLNYFNEISFYHVFLTNIFSKHKTKFIFFWFFSCIFSPSKHLSQKNIFLQKKMFDTKKVFGQFFFEEGREKPPIKWQFFCAIVNIKNLTQSCNKVFFEGAPPVNS